MTLGLLGLGKMGSRIARKLSSEHTVLTWNRTPKDNSLPTIEALIKKLPKPRIVWLMLPARHASAGVAGGPAGDPTETVLQEVLTYIEGGDVVIDGGNAHFKDTQKRFDQFKQKGIHFLGIGLSGGVIAEKTGYPLMVGGDKRGYEIITPLLDSLANPNGGHAFFGEGGAGHFVKMVHNGIEYGLMQSLGEGFEVLSKSPYNLNLLSVAKLWQKGTLVSGFMLDRVVEALPQINDVVGVIAESGEAKWTVETAKEQGTDVEIIERSLEYRKRSQTDPKIQQSFTAKLVAALRNAFGGHEVRKK